MKIYLVGGAVRDQQLGLPIKDRDFVVVGSSVQEMLEKGFQPVGKDFPVFLHPKTKEEYALARKERKTAAGYTGFEFITDPTVTLEDDLLRRDLTINAMALDLETEQLIDPHNGLEDIKSRTLRHVSDAFSEDPLRVLRTARFLARFSYLGFKIDNSTIKLMQKMVDNGEVDHLVPERVWQELKATLNSESPSSFIKALKSCGALKVLFPEIDCLFGVPQTRKWHPEIDTGIHAMLAMDQAKDLDNDTAFAVFTHDLGKGITPEKILPSHRGHEFGGIPLVKDLCKRLKVPTNYKKLALTVCQWHLHSHIAFELKPETIHKVFTRTAAYHQPKVFSKFLQACQADATGRTGLEFTDYPQANYLRACLDSTLNITAKNVENKELEGKALGLEIDRLKIIEIKKVKESYQA